MKLTLEIPCNRAVEAVRNITVASHIIRTVSCHFNIGICDLESSARQWYYCWPRWVAIILIRRHTTLSSTQIGLLFNRDHGSILHAVKGAIAQAATDPKSAAELDKLDAFVRVLPRAKRNNAPGDGSQMFPT